MVKLITLAVFAAMYVAVTARAVSSESEESSEEYQSMLRLKVEAEVGKGLLGIRSPPGPPFRPRPPHVPPGERPPHRPHPPHTSTRHPPTRPPRPSEPPSTEISIPEPETTTALASNTAAMSSESPEEFASSTVPWWWWSATT